MNLLQAVCLGLVQGVAEFLPISSSGHLVIGQSLFGIKEPPVLFDILLHIGTLISVIVYFNKKIFTFFSKPRNILLVFIGSVPAGAAGFLLNPFLNKIFGSLLIVGISLIITSILLFLVDRFKGYSKDLNKLKWKDSLFIGFFQSLALFPGVSRSGATISGAVFRGLKRESAFIFSFYLGAPVFAGALLMQIPDIASNGDQLFYGLIGMVVAGFSGYFSLKLLKKAVIKKKLSFFAFYCLFLGVLLIFV